MATTSVSKGTIIFCDLTKRGSASIIVKALAYGTPITKEKIDTLADAIVAVSDCALKEEKVLDVVREDAPAYTGNKDRKGLLICQEPDGTVHKWGIPGIKTTECETTEGTQGEHIKAATVTTLAAAFATCTGLTLTGLYSPVIQTT